MTSATPQVQVGVGVFVLQSSQESPSNPRFLTTKRLKSHGTGTYCLPGGHLEYGETPEECAAREVMEETGLKVSNIRFLTATNDIMSADRKHYVTLMMVCVRENETEEPRNMEPEKHAGWEWMMWETLVARATNEEKNGSDDLVKLFLPLRNLIKQRPGAIPTVV